MDIAVYYIRVYERICAHTDNYTDWFIELPNADLYYSYSALAELTATSSSDCALSCLQSASALFRCQLFRLSVTGKCTLYSQAIDPTDALQVVWNTTGITIYALNSIS